jgi:hypothetical protein
MDPVTKERIRRSMQKGFWWSPGTVLACIAIVGSVTALCLPFADIREQEVDILFGGSRGPVMVHHLHGLQMFFVYLAIALGTLFMTLIYLRPNRLNIPLFIASFPWTGILAAIYLEFILFFYLFSDVNFEIKVGGTIFIISEVVGGIGSILILIRYNRIRKRETDPGPS